MQITQNEQYDPVLLQNLWSAGRELQGTGEYPVHLTEANLNIKRVFDSIMEEKDKFNMSVWHGLSFEIREDNRPVMTDVKHCLAGVAHLLFEPESFDRVIEDAVQQMGSTSLIALRRILNGDSIGNNTTLFPADHEPVLEAGNKYIWPLKHLFMVKDEYLVTKSIKSYIETINA